MDSSTSKTSHLGRHPQNKENKLPHPAPSPSSQQPPKPQIINCWEETMLIAFLFMFLFFVCTVVVVHSLSPSHHPTTINTGNAPSIQQSDHCVVISHGIMGTRNDLDYLASQLEKRGVKVLKSVANERLKSLRGLAVGGEDLASEIVQFVKANPSLTRLSIVGNSLGGLYARYAMHVLFNATDGTLAGLKPHRLMTIATPHLGVRNWTFVEDMFGGSLLSKAPGLDLIKKLVSKTMLSSGRGVFGFDGDDNGGKTLLYQMATEEKFLIPLRSFSNRRLYANLQKDFVVPLGTAAFLHNDAVNDLRKSYGSQSGRNLLVNQPSADVVTCLHTLLLSHILPSLTLSHNFNPAYASSTSVSLCVDISQFSPSDVLPGIVSILRTGNGVVVNDLNTESDSSCEENNHHSSSQSSSSSKQSTHKDTNTMITTLDSLGWEKVVVNFPRSILPLAHNKICALTRSPTWLYHNVLGFNEGKFVMENATSWLSE